MIENFKFFELAMRMFLTIALNRRKIQYVSFENINNTIKKSRFTSIHSFLFVQATFIKLSTATCNYLTISSNSSNWSNTLQYRCSTRTQAHFIPGHGAKLRSRPSSRGHLPIAILRRSSAPVMVGYRFFRSSIGFRLRVCSGSAELGIRPRLISAPDRVG